MISIFLILLYFSVNSSFILGYFRDTSVKDEEIALKPGEIINLSTDMAGIIVKGDPQSDNTTFVTMKYQDSSHSY